MDQLLAPELFNGVGVVALFSALFWLLATGRLVTRREAEGITKRAEKAEETRDTLIKQNAELMEMARLGQDVFTALRKGAER